MSPARASLLVAALLLAACRPALEVAAPVPTGESPVEVAAPAPPATTAGRVRVAVPAEPAGGLPVGDLDTAGADLLALWGLPLYRTGPDGALVPALVDRARVSADGRRVRLSLRAGSWSDGRPVTAADVRATVLAVSAHEQGEELGWLEDVEVVDERTVRLRLRQPTRRWSRLLSTTGVLPAHVLEDTDLDDLAAPPEVVGGAFRPVEAEAGLRRRFAAHRDGPLGAPAIDHLEVVVVPSFDTALGLLGDGAVEAVMGHLAIRPGLRVAAMAREEDLAVGEDELEVAAPTGGTEVVLRLTERGTLTDPTRARRVLGLADVRHQVEGLGLGLLPNDPEPPDAAGGAGPLPDGLEIAVVLNNEQEALVATARLLEAQLRGDGARLRLEGEPTPDDVRRAAHLDAALVVRRQASWREVRARGGEQLRELVLYRARVAHVWHERLEGVEPSAWPGTGLAGAPSWRLPEGG